DMGPTISHRVVVRLSSVLRFLYACFGDLQDLHSFPTRRSSDLAQEPPVGRPGPSRLSAHLDTSCDEAVRGPVSSLAHVRVLDLSDRKSTRLNSSHDQISYAVFCLTKKKQRSPLHTHSQQLYMSY